VYIKGALCPGPVFTLIPLFSFEIGFVFLTLLVAGQFAAHFIEKHVFMKFN
jgi:hypothetical protein